MADLRGFCFQRKCVSISTISIFLRWHLLIFTISLNNLLYLENVQPVWDLFFQASRTVEGWYCDYICYFLVCNVLGPEGKECIVVSILDKHQIIRRWICFLHMSSEMVGWLKLTVGSPCCSLCRDLLLRLQGPVMPCIKMIICSGRWTQPTNNERYFLVKKRKEN